ncbi:TIGR02466 family protein [Zoogloea sp.]|uniref:TIGR02466 family protein n=1 Tax=Zoogloea sp. TaxID=49181 RepID=UPI0035AF6C38
MNIQVVPNDLFVTRIWQFELGGLAENFAAWERAIRSWRAEAPLPAGRSNRSGWNSAPTLFDQPIFAPLRDIALQCFRHAITEMKPTKAISFGLQAWVNMHDTGGHNMLHAHPNALLSGCFYLTVPDGSGGIVFRDPRPGVVLTSFPGSGCNCSNDVGCQPKPGQLYVFPHWLEHRVETNASQESRIAIAINAAETK